MRRFFLTAVAVLGLGFSADADDVFLSGKNLKLSTWGVSKVGNGVGKWYTHHASAWWNFEVMEDGEYHIFLSVSGDAKTAGSILKMKLNDFVLPDLQMPDTGGLDSFKIVRITNNPIRLKAGVNKLLLKTNKIVGKEVGNFGMGLVTKQSEISEIPNYAVYQKNGDFAETFTWLKKSVAEMGNPSIFRLNYKSLWNDFPHEMVWLTQDLTDLKVTNMNPEFDFERAVCDYFAPNRDSSMEKKLIDRAISELPEDAQKKYRTKSEGLNNALPTDSRWLKLYSEICKERRKIRIAPLLKETDKIIFAKHQVFGSLSGIYNITEYEGLHDWESSSLNTLDLTPEKNGEFATTSILKDAEGGILRDPVISPDAKKMLYAWRPTSDQRSWAVKNKDYKIYEMDFATGESRKLTSDETYGADYEATYLPNGNIIFNSSRIVQHITCGWGDHSNLFIMDKDGKYQRRVGFDQVSTQFPTLLNDGSVIYLRRDYNDRGQVAAHALFTMNQDGTMQDDFYGNQTGTPTSFMHACANSKFA